MTIAQLCKQRSELITANALLHDDVSTLMAKLSKPDRDEFRHLRTVYTQQKKTISNLQTLIGRLKELLAEEQKKRFLQLDQDGLGMGTGRHG